MVFLALLDASLVVVQTKRDYPQEDTHNPVEDEQPVCPIDFSVELIVVHMNVIPRFQRLLEIAGISHSQWL